MPLRLQPAGKLLRQVVGPNQAAVESHSGCIHLEPAIRVDGEVFKEFDSKRSDAGDWLQNLPPRDQ